MGRKPKWNWKPWHEAFSKAQSSGWPNQQLSFVLENTPYWEEINIIIPSEEEQHAQEMQ